MGWWVGGNAHVRNKFRRLSCLRLDFHPSMDGKSLCAQQAEKSLHSACASLSVGEAHARPKLGRGGLGKGVGVGYVVLGLGIIRVSYIAGEL